MVNTRSYLEQLPKEIATGEVARNLDEQDLTSIVQVSHSMYQLFQKPLKAAKLLHFVKISDYAKAAAMVDADPALIFQPIMVKNQDGTFSTTTPLRLAFELLDTYMWKMFLKKIKNNTGLVNCFLKQAHEQTEHINLEPLFVAYKAYKAHLKRWLAYEITDDQLRLAWLDIGKMQRNLLPRHILKEFCRISDPSKWSADANFDVDSDPCPTRCDIYNSIFLIENVPLLPFVPNEGLGYDFTLARGRLSFAVGRRTTIGISWESDVAAFHRLYEIRNNDFVKQISQLEPALQQQVPGCTCTI